MNTSAIRLGYVDYVKGIAILLVVLGHALQYSGLMDHWLFNWIYSFHMPLFMMVSGFVCRQTAGWSVCRRRLGQLMIPFFSAIPAYYIYHSLCGGFSDGFVRFTYAVLAFPPNKGLWFLWALFFITLIFVGCRESAAWICRKSGYRHTLGAEIAVTVTVACLLNIIEIKTGTQLFCFNLIAWHFLYFISGVYLRILLERYPGLFSVRMTVCITAIFLLTAPFFKLTDSVPTFYRYIDLGQVFAFIYRFAVGLFGSMSVILLCRAICGTGIRTDMLTGLGRITLGIYYFHFMFIYSLCGRFDFIPLWSAVMLVTAMSLAASWATVRLCQCSALTKAVFLGQLPARTKTVLRPQASE